MLTGGDTVRARHLYQDAFDFRPQCKLRLAANHAPKLRGDDPALRRRILRIPFEHAVPAERRDPTIKAALRDPSEAGAAILAWAVQGCLDWQRARLGVPPVVQAATKVYQEEMDTFPDFLDDCCVTGREYRVAFRDLFQAYEDWRRRNRERALSRKAFGLQLKAHGSEPGDSTKTGLALAPIGHVLDDDDKPATDAAGA